METKSVDTDLLVVTRRYPATPEQVFKALTTKEAIEQWFGPNDEMTVTLTDFDPSVGGKYRIHMRHQFGNEHVVGGIFKEIDSPNRLVYSFTWEDETMAGIGTSEVAYDLKEIDGGTELTLTQSGLPGKEAIDGHRMGWNGGLWRLERLFGASSLHHDSVILALNRKLYTNALKGISEKDLSRKVSDKANHLNWVAGHVAHTRASIANMLGASFESPLEAYNKAIEDNSKLVDLDTIQEVFTGATNALHGALSTASEELLDSPAPFELPITDNTMGGFVAFLVQHEAYHIGQMGILRKALGYEATSYA